jgi:hypothetical protein
MLTPPETAQIEELSGFDKAAEAGFFVLGKPGNETPFHDRQYPRRQTKMSRSRWF